jgi:segregation and condensation protein B
MTLTIKHAVEALVFASPKPLSIEEIAKAIRAGAVESEVPELQPLSETKQADVAAALEELKAEYAQQARAFQLTEQVNGWAIATVKETADFVRQLYPEAKPTRLSGPALETLAIIAYRQPVTRADIEAVRGVAVDGVMQVLLDRSLVKITGRAEVPGRPLLYATTEYFLQHFGLKNVDELPNADELRRVALPKAEIPAEEKPAEPASAPQGTAGEDFAPADTQRESAEVAMDAPTPAPEN